MKRSSIRTLVASVVIVAAMLGRATSTRCPPRDPLPEAPLRATDLNGQAWPDFCFEERALEEHFFIIGDWGGLFRPNMDPIPANNRKGAPIVMGVDDRAQVLVAEQMKIRANTSQPRYLLNVGDNFYWGGVETTCGSSANHVQDSALSQWRTVFESVYDGPDLAGKPWLGVLGNHDYGGYKFTMGWDQAIAYTWGPSDRWLTPAQYWSTKVHYHDFSVDYVFVESNVNDAFRPQDMPGHNICSEKNNPVGATCGATGPTSPAHCTDWFLQLWLEQKPWIARVLDGSQSDWRIVVTHYPPQFRQDDWARIAAENKIDLIVTGHKHEQKVSNRDPAIGGAAWVVSGGGGGITSEGLPRLDGDDDQYGFFDVTISKSEIKLEAISHSGIVRSTTVVESRATTTTETTTFTVTSTTTTTTTTSTTTTTTTPTVSTRLRSGERHSDYHDGTGGQASMNGAMHGFGGARVSGEVLLLLFVVSLVGRSTASTQ